MMLRALIAAAILSLPATAQQPSPAEPGADADLVCLVILAASIKRARVSGNLAPDQQETVKSWEVAVGYFAGRALTRFDDAGLNAAVTTAGAEAERRDPYRATIECDRTYRDGMKRLQQGFVR